MKNLKEIALAIYDSEYHISATGFRGVGVDEIIDILKIITRNEPSAISSKLKRLYEHHPATIEMSKYQQKSSCDWFIEGVCDCFLPDVSFEDCYCSRERRKQLETSDYRGTPEYQEWRRGVFQRDEYTCQKCGQIGGNLNAHHIKKFKDFPKQRYDIDNGLTLCIDCHKEEHKNKSKKRTSNAKAK